jgi:Tripartite tricarboxylate transporter family receptor
LQRILRADDHPLPERGFFTRDGSTSLTIEQIRAGKLRPLAVTTATRWEGLPDIPTVNDFVSGCEASAFVGLGAPRNTPDHRQAQQGGQRGSRRSEAEGADDAKSAFASCGHSAASALGSNVP